MSRLVACELGLAARDGQKQRIHSTTPPATEQQEGEFVIGDSSVSSCGRPMVVIGPEISPSSSSFQPPSTPYASLLFPHVTMNIYLAKAATTLREQFYDGAHQDGKREKQPRRHLKLGQVEQIGPIARLVYDGHMDKWLKWYMGIVQKCRQIQKFLP